MAEPLNYASPPDESTRFPAALTVVAWLFIAFGILAAGEMIVAIVQGRFFVNLGVLGVLIGRGLFRLSRGWRTCALAFLWLGGIVSAIVFVMIIFGANVTFHGARVDKRGATALGLLMSAGMLVLTVWQYHVLTRPDVRRLFRLPTPLF